MSSDPQRRIVFRSDDYRTCAEAALVLAARELEHEVHQVGSEWRLSVPLDIAAAAQAELDSYLREIEATRRTRDNAAVLVGERSSGWRGVLVYAAVLLAMATVANRPLAGLDWHGMGMLDAASVRAGEWWRTVTALTLHADLSHLLGNLAFGSFFGHFVARHLGEGIGWAAVLLSGAGGNWLNAWLQPLPHRAIGASTAVFGALAILSAYSWRSGLYRHTTRRAQLGPLVAGLGLLAFTGTGGENTDLLAHLLGFCVGLAFGALLAHRSAILEAAGQRIAVIVTVALLASAWLVAFESSASR